MNSLGGIALLCLVAITMASNQKGYGSETYPQTYRGKFEGKCDKDGFYYQDDNAFMICSNGNAYRQACAPGSRNSGFTTFANGNSYNYRDFCDVNLVDYGYNLRYGKSGYGNAGQAKSGYGKPSYEKPSYEKPSYEKPSYEKPSYEKPSYEKPSYGKSGYAKPAPRYEEPRYEEPSYGYDYKPVVRQTHYPEDNRVSGYGNIGQGYRYSAY